MTKPGSLRRAVGREGSETSTGGGVLNVSALNNGPVRGEQGSTDTEAGIRAICVLFRWGRAQVE